VVPTVIGGGDVCDLEIKSQYRPNKLMVCFLLGLLTFSLFLHAVCVLSCPIFFSSFEIILFLVCSACYYSSLYFFQSVEPEPALAIICK